MAQRRQALRRGKPTATSFFFALIPTIFFTLPSISIPSISMPSISAKAETANSAAADLLVVLGDARQAALFTFLLMLLSGVTLVLSLYRRRDDTSPRRIGRRI